MMRSIERIITRGNQLYVYYCGVHGAHTGPKVKNVVRRHPVQIGLLNQRRDGFISLDAGREEGMLTTRPFELPQGQLFLNTDARDGEVYVAVLNRSGQLVAKSQVISGNQHGVPVLDSEDRRRDPPAVPRAQCKNLLLVVYGLKTGFVC